MADRQCAIDLLLVCDEWKSSKGGVSTLNRDLSANFAKISAGKINVHCYVSKSDHADKEDAKRNGVNLLTAQKIPGAENPHEWLKFPPQELSNIDVVIGHGRKFGLPAQFISKIMSICKPCKLIQFLHVYCMDLGKYKKSKSFGLCLGTDTIHDNERKHENELELCEVADAVVAVGPALKQKYQRSLPDTEVQVFTPGISENFLVENQPPQWQLNAEEEYEFRVLVCGRASAEDLSLKGYDVIANAIALLGKKFKLEFVGSPAAKQRKLERWFLNNTNITREQLTIHSFADQTKLKRLFRSSDVVTLPSRTEGFGLVILEAISADTSVLVSGEAGISKALKMVEGGNSVIVESPEDPNEWAKRILELDNQSVQERHERAVSLRKNYAKRYSWADECQKLLSLVENLVAGADRENGQENNSQPSQPSANSESERSPQQSRKRSRAEVDSEFQRSFPMVLEAALFQYFDEIFGKRTLTESRGLRWGDVDLVKDHETDSEWLVLNDGSSRAKQQEMLRHPLQSRAVKLYKFFETRRPPESKTAFSPFYLAVKPKVSYQHPVWYMNKAQAVAKIGKHYTKKTPAKRPRR